MILDDEEDILKLYNDYLSSKGHKILHAYVNADNILEDIDIECPTLYTPMPSLHAALEIIDFFILS